MSISKAYTAHVMGLKMEPIVVEVDISNGLNSFSIIGLGDRSVDEAKDRISAAIKNIGYTSPKQKNQKVIISLAPAHVRKEGTSFDLAMAMAYLSATGDVEFEYKHTLFLGELSLEGSTRKTYGVLSILVQAAEHGFTTAFIPKENIPEATLARDMIIYGVSTLREVVDHFMHIKRLTPITHEYTNDNSVVTESEHDFVHIRGNETAKRALEIAATGYHNIILYGPPGTGKTMLAKSLHSILPNLSYEQSVEVTSIHSIAGTLESELITRPPFRSPHHTASTSSILGGGNTLKPGEITLAHRGVLLLDELPEFDREVIEGLRQPLEDRAITVSRMKGTAVFPAQCILVATMNPCRCGKGKEYGCTCSPRSIEQYRQRISSAVFDRIDIWVQVPRVDHKKINPIDEHAGESSTNIRTRIMNARKIQELRYDTYNKEKKGYRQKYFNSEMAASDIYTCALLDDATQKIISPAIEKLGLSARAYYRIIKVARTIADLDGSEKIQKKHMLEALQYRQKIM